MALRVSLLPGRSSFNPGDFLTAKVEVANQSDTKSKAAFSLTVASLAMEVVCNERVDHTWVALAYGAEVAPTEKDNRRETREVFHSAPTTLGEGFKLQPGQSRAWTIRMALPEWLPPSFRGVAARYGYVLLATIRFSGSPAAMQLLTQHLSLDHFRRASGGNLLRLSLGKLDGGKGAVRGGAKADTPIEQTAVAKAPVTILPLQRSQGEFSERLPTNPGLVVGADSELASTTYSHGSWQPEVDVQDVLERREEAPSGRPRAGFSPSHSDRSFDVDEVSSSSPAPSSADQGGGGVRQKGAAFGRQAWDPHESSLSSSRSDQSGAGVDTEWQSAGVPQTPMSAVEPASMRSFNLKLSDKLLARLTLHPPAQGPLCLGSTLSGTLDFRSSQEAAGRDPSLPKCVQMVVQLETEERVAERWGAAAAAHLTSSSIRQVQDEHQELTPDTLLTHFMLSIPHDAPASFSTHLVTLRWLLRFEFITNARPPATGWLGGGAVAPEKLSWALPILVVPSRT